MTAPLAGLRVLDVSTLFAGPFAATFLGDFGAGVIKVEHPTRPDAVLAEVGVTREQLDLLREKGVV